MKQGQLAGMLAHRPRGIFSRRFHLARRGLALVVLLVVLYTTLRSHRQPSWDVESRASELDLVESQAREIQELRAIISELGVVGDGTEEEHKTRQKVDLSWMQYWSNEPVVVNDEVPAGGRFAGLLERHWSFEEDGVFGARSEDVERPQGVRKIVGLVFYGRRATVSILDCYLKRNLVRNGGVLDEVVFLARTKDKADLEFLDGLLADEPSYTRWKWDGAMGYSSAYDNVENGVLYVKIDDDVVFLDDTAIPSIVQTKLAHPEYYFVSANIINTPLLSFLHLHGTALRPFLPELRPFVNAHPASRTEWRTEHLPAWDFSDSFNMSLEWMPSRKPGDSFRWLPLRDKSRHGMGDTPAAKTQYDAFGTGWRSWTIGAQQHYSFFENLESGELRRYRFGVWDLWGRRMGIQCMAIMGDDINAAKPVRKDDEGYFSEVMPEKTGRHAVVDGRALASHYSFYLQKKGMDVTDILERYRTFAKENICEAKMRDVT